MGFKFEPVHEISNNVVCVTSKSSDQPAHTRSLISLCLSLEYPMSDKLLTEHHLRFLSLKGGCTGWSDSTPVKMPHCWKSRVTAHFVTNMLSSWARTQVSDRYFLRPGYRPNISSFPIKKKISKNFSKW